MSAVSVNKRRGRGSEAPEPDACADDVLCYADQGSFIGLRALGRGPVLHLTWLYPHLLDEFAVQEFNERLAQGLLGRVLQRSPLPWGRHRWAARPAPAPVTWFRDQISLECLPEWRSGLVNLPVDPEHGPGWRLAVQLLEGGGCALSILVSHTIADGQAASQAIADAVAGRRLEHGFPAPSRRWSPALLACDIVESVRALPAAWRALTALVRTSGKQANPLSRAASTSPWGGHKAPGSATNVPLVQVVMDAGVIEERASGLGVRSNTLLTAFATRLAFRMGRVDVAGRVKLVLPVSDRQPDDRRGNALRSVALMVDPNTCRSNPLGLQDALKAALSALRQHGDEMSPLFPLVPYVPLWLARHMERLALGADLPVGCSILGELPPDLNRPCGEASLLQYSVLERFTGSVLERLGGQLFLVCYRVGGRMLVTVSGYAPNRITTRAELAPLVRDALADLDLYGTVS